MSSSLKKEIGATLTRIYGLEKPLIIVLSCLLLLWSCASSREPSSHLLKVDREKFVSSPILVKETEGWLGIFFEQGENGAIRINRVIEGSPAKKAGAKENDIILKVNDEPVPADFRIAISKYKPGAEIKLTIIRDGIEKNLLVTLAQKPWITPSVRAHPEFRKSRRLQGDSILEAGLKETGLGLRFFRVLDLIWRQSLAPEGFESFSLTNPFRLSETNYLLRNPLDTPLVADGLVSSFREKLKRKDLGGLIEIAANELDVDIKEEKSAKTARGTPLNDFINNLILEMQEALKLRKEALSELTSEEINFLFSRIPGILLENDVNEQDSLNTLRFCLKIDYLRLFKAGMKIVSCMDMDYLESLKDRPYTAQEGIQSKEFEGDIVSVRDTDIGEVIIGGKGPTIYRSHAAIIVDLGGDDRYENNAGCSSQDYPFTIVIDLEGDDIYQTQNNFSQGSGILGAGILIDMEGDDLYQARNLSQGCGILGLSILCDLQGDDQYFGDQYVQGAGFFGIGWLVEGAGHDQYTSKRYAQGFGYVRGFGALMDAEDSDHYFAGGEYPDFRDPENATQSCAQGFGLGIRPYNSPIGASGGIGIVIDEEGNDTYVADYFSQGASYWCSVGILHDKKGNDCYQSGRYSQGAGIHSSIGLLVDRGGNDAYLATYGVSQGCGHDLGVGILIDDGGDDRYESGILCQGAGNANGLGILTDSGGNNEFLAQGKGQGMGILDSMGILMCCGKGKNYYSLAHQGGPIIVKDHWNLILTNP